MNKISVITINYNNLNGLINTVTSVFDQTYLQREFIIIDGGSTDGSKEFIEKKSTEFTYWVSEKDKGVYHAMNKGLAKATGDFCLFLNSGDILFKNNILSDFSKLIDILRFEQGIAIISTSSGVMSHIKAEKLKKGGEILCYIG
jgi:glycosyltransferase involved in cell wall biosynthesis